MAQLNGKLVQTDNTQINSSPFLPNFVQITYSFQAEDFYVIFLYFIFLAMVAMLV